MPPEPSLEHKLFLEAQHLLARAEVHLGFWSESAVLKEAPKLSAELKNEIHSFLERATRA